MSFTYIQITFFFSLLLGVTGLFIWMLGNYLFPVFWAIVFAVIFYPLFQYIERHINHLRSFAAILTITVICILFIAPSVWVGGLVVNESLDLYQQATDDGETLSITHHSASLAQFLAPYGISETTITDRLESWIGSGAAWLSTSFVAASQVTLTFVIHTGIMLYLLFFLLRDGQALQKKLSTYLPLADEYEHRLISRFTETTRAVISGTLAIAAIQGLIGGITFWIAGISSPILWGVAMMLLAIIPAIGPMLVWLPAGIFLLATGSVWEGVTILVAGIGLVSLIDEFLRPTLVGRRANMPDAFILLATVGGLSTFGLSGLVVGPVLAAFFLALWNMFEERYHIDLTNTGKAKA